MSRGLEKRNGYEFGIAPGVSALNECKRLGIPEVTIYGFTQDNTRRAPDQVAAFRDACVAFAQAAMRCGVGLLVLGDAKSPLFPAELRAFLTRQGAGLRVNLLVNYGWEWDLAGLKNEGQIRSNAIPRLDLIVRWGGGRRLSGFLPVQSVYADIFVVDEYWPDFQPGQLQEAIEWFGRQDQTLGG